MSGGRINRGFGLSIGTQTGAERAWCAAVNLCAAAAGERMRKGWA